MNVTTPVVDVLVPAGHEVQAAAPAKRKTKSKKKIARSGQGIKLSAVVGDGLIVIRTPVNNIRVVHSFTQTLRNSFECKDYIVTLSQ